jgi:hypothetical protein
VALAAGVTAFALMAKVVGLDTAGEVVYAAERSPST